MGLMENIRLELRYVLGILFHALYITVTANFCEGGEPHL